MGMAVYEDGTKAASLNQEQLLYQVMERAYRLLRYEGLTTRSAQARALLLQTVEKYETEKGIKHARDE